jgi:hypothetical protein
MSTCRDSRLASNFSVLRHSRHSQDELPELARGALMGAGAMSGAAPDLGRRVTAGDQFTHFLVPGSGALCDVLSGGESGSGASCVATEVAVSEGISVTTAAASDGSARSVYGIVPDWVTSVRFRAPDGTAVEADVSTNGY